MPKGPRIISGPRRPASRVLSVRVPAAVADALEVEAQSRGITSATVIREVLVQGTTYDPDDVQPVRAYRPAKPKPSIDVVEVARLREALGETGGTLRQLAGLARRDGQPCWLEIESLLPEIRAAAARVDGIKAALE